MGSLRLALATRRQGSKARRCTELRSVAPAGAVEGAQIQTSLLEKARTCAFFNGERSFHIFYMLCYYKSEVTSEHFSSAQFRTG